ncbi:O-antigen ligase family protein [Mesobacillus jeotgali]|uniref:O-antigen ligase family protein n=1 Tax=Mesobacillus jeotgali TaxID=129985 RepID=UPI0009A8A0B4|nr:O-antigen ligase family protein [Mesobacillus jeotgali]
MLKTKREIELTRIFSILFFPLLLFNVLGETVLQPYRDQARVAVDITLVISFLLLIYLLIKDKGIGFEYKKIYLGFILLSGIYLLTHIINDNFKENEQLLLLYLTFAFIILTMKIKWRPDHIIIFGYIVNMVIIFFFFHWINNDYTLKMYKGIFGNSNVFATFLFSLLYFQAINIYNKSVINRVLFLLGTALNLILIYMTTSRAALLSVVVILGSWLLLKFSRQLFSKLFYLVIAANFLFLGLYVLLAKSSYADTINNLSLRYTQKLFFSGRENIWGDVIDFGMTSPLYGHKVGIHIKEYIFTSPVYHVHNQYLQVFVEVGFLGLFTFLLLLFFIWKSFQKNLDCNYVQWSACFFLGLLVFQNIEISLFFNMQAIGMIQWLIISIGVSMSMQKIEYNNHEPNIRRRYRGKLLSKV